MSLLKQILTNNITLALGHEPCKEELATMIKYINDRVDILIGKGSKPTLADIATAILDCQSDCFIECTCTGGYYLPDDMTEASDGARVAIEHLSEYEQELEWDRDNKKELLDRWHGLY